MGIAHLLIHVFWLAGLLLLGSMVWQAAVVLVIITVAAVGPTRRWISHSGDRAAGAAHVQSLPPRPRQTHRSPRLLPRETTVVCRSGPARARDRQNRGWPGVHRGVRGCYASSA